MVINSTSTVDVSIQALSPLLTVGSAQAAVAVSRPAARAINPALVGRLNVILKSS
jgi:hypothetical protein